MGTVTRLKPLHQHKAAVKSRIGYRWEADTSPYFRDIVSMIREETRATTKPQLEINLATFAAEAGFSVACLKSWLDGQVTSPIRATLMGAERALAKRGYTKRILTLHKTWLEG